MEAKAVKKPKYKYKNKLGYVLVKDKGHPRSHKGYVFEHILVVERALGKPLPPKAVVHHVDGDTANNTPSNLVICQNQKYHHLLHMRIRAKEASGFAFYRLCVYCGKHDDPVNLYIAKRGSKTFHRKCRNAYEKKQYHKRKEGTL